MHLPRARAVAQPGGALCAAAAVAAEEARARGRGPAAAASVLHCPAAPREVPRTHSAALLLILNCW